MLAAGRLSGQRRIPASRVLALIRLLQELKYRLFHGQQPWRERNSSIRKTLGPPSSGRSIHNPQIRALPSASGWR
jgi:hypothetical protein